MQRPTPPATRSLFALLLCLPISCAQLDTQRGEGMDRDRSPLFEGDGSTADQDARPDPVRAALARIARLNQGRQTGGGYLQTLAEHTNPRVREQAVRALGRMPLDPYGANVTAALENALGDRESRVREAAVFSLGVRKDLAATNALRQATEDRDPGVRAQAWLALARIGGKGARLASRHGMQEKSSLSKGAAARSVYLWPTEKGSDAPEQMEWDLIREGLIMVAQEDPSEAAWQALFTMSRRSEVRHLPAFLNALEREGSSTWERLFAVRGAARSLEDGAGPSARDKVSSALHKALDDPDYRVVVEALIGLRTQTLFLPTEHAATALEHDSAHVRAAAVLALDPKAQRPEPAQMLGHDPSPMVRRAAFEAYILQKPGDAVARVREWGRSRDYRQRRAAAMVAKHLESEEGRGLVFGLLQDRHPQVAGEAIAALKEFPGDESRARLHRYCHNEDNGRALAAVTTLGELELNGKDLPALIHAYKNAHGDGGMEVCFNALRTGAKIDGTEATEFLRAGLLHEDPFVARVAQKALADRGIEAEIPLAAGGSVIAAKKPATPFDPSLPSPRVWVKTSRGTMEFVLFPSVAPTHVASFLTLAERGHFDGLIWHRVVSDFVIQGGCYRGDGNGGGTWRGVDDALGQEFSELTYREGALGMPRNENPDSGGSQIFVTHRPTPHLDGRYTLFGQLMNGFEVLHAIEEGDRILSITRQP